jgi:hypothetical protein
MLESDLRDLLSRRIDVLEPGLRLVAKEQYIPNSVGTRGFIDLLAHDRDNRWVLIELKRSNAAAREAIHEIYKYAEGVKAHLRVRDDELRVIIASTEWRELLVPFSRFVDETNISVLGIALTVVPATGEVLASNVAPLPIARGRILSPWHEIGLYKSEERLQEGITSYDGSCAAKGIEDYVLVVLKAPDDFYERAVAITADAMSEIRNGTRASENDIKETFEKMDRLDWMIYFVPQLLTAEAYLKIIERSPELFDEVQGFYRDMGEEEALCSLQEYALGAEPKVDRDYIEIGYPAKFKSKLLEDEGWTIKAILRRGAFQRNAALTDETIIGEIAGEAGTSGQRFKRSIRLNEKSAVSTAMGDIKECLANNEAWANQIVAQLEETRREYPEATADISIFSPSTGVFTLFFTTSREDGALYLPSYSIRISDGAGVVRRLYVGELQGTNDIHVPSDAFHNILRKYYDGDIGHLLMTMTWGGYESRDSEILEDLNLDYASFRCDMNGVSRTFLRNVGNRWKKTGDIVPLAAYRRFLERNERLLRIVNGKIAPRMGSGMWDGSPARGQLSQYVVPELAAKGRYFVDPPDACDICECPLSFEPFMSDAKVKRRPVWANMCADCSVYHAEGIGWGVGQLYENKGDGKWLLVAGVGLDDIADE